MDLDGFNWGFALYLFKGEYYYYNFFTYQKQFLETQRMAQHFHNDFITLLYFTLTCKKLTSEQLWKYCDDKKMS